MAANHAQLTDYEVVTTLSPQAMVASPFELCLFDLDQTLLRTDDFAHLRGRQFLNETSDWYTAALIAEFNNDAGRIIYTESNYSG